MKNENNIFKQNTHDATKRKGTEKKTKTSKAIYHREELHFKQKCLRFFFFCLKLDKIRKILCTSENSQLLLSFCLCNRFCSLYHFGSTYKRVHTQNKTARKKKK